MGPAVALAFSVLVVSGACLETSVLFGKCVFMLKGEFEETPWSHILGHPWLGPSPSDGGEVLWVRLKQTKLLRKNCSHQGLPRRKKPESASPHHSVSLLKSDWLI